jgi:hypothetical protein
LLCYRKQATENNNSSGGYEMRKALVWRFGIAGTTLLAAIAVYCLTRIYPPELLAPFQATNSIFADKTGLFGSAPTFLYTLAIGLIIGACASLQSCVRARAQESENRIPISKLQEVAWKNVPSRVVEIHCSIWIGLALLLELTQHPVFAEPLASRLSETLSVSVWEIIGPYWHRGTFDPLDLIATVAGGLIALVILTHSPREIKNACG